jgi:hypothetical protein
MAVFAMRAEQLGQWPLRPPGAALLLFDVVSGPLQSSRRSGAVVDAAAHQPPAAHPF